MKRRTGKNTKFIEGLDYFILVFNEGNVAEVNKFLDKRNFIRLVEKEQNRLENFDLFDMLLERGMRISVENFIRFSVLYENTHKFREVFELISDENLEFLFTQQEVEEQLVLHSEEFSYLLIREMRSTKVHVAFCRALISASTRIQDRNIEKSIILTLLKEEDFLIEKGNMGYSKDYDKILFTASKLISKVFKSYSEEEYEKADEFGEDIRSFIQTLHNANVINDVLDEFDILSKT